MEAYGEEEIKGVSPLFHHGQREVTGEWGRWANSTRQESEGELGVQSDVLMETWLHQDIPDNNLSISGFQTVRADWDHTESGQREGGRPAVLVGVILVTLFSSRNSQVILFTLRVFSRCYHGCLHDFNHVSMHSFYIILFFTSMHTRSTCKEKKIPWG